MDDLISELKVGIIKHLGFDDMEPDEIETDAPLFETGLGLDSIDALELVVLLKESYGIEIKDIEEGKTIFASIQVLSEFVKENRQK